jgi:hypothetical protein
MVLVSHRSLSALGVARARGWPDCSFTGGARGTAFTHCTCSSIRRMRSIRRGDFEASHRIVHDQTARGVLLTTVRRLKNGADGELTRPQTTEGRSSRERHRSRRADQRSCLDENVETRPDEPGALGVVLAELFRLWLGERLASPKRLLWVSGVDPSFGELDVGAVPTHVPIYQSHALSSVPGTAEFADP